MGNRPVIILHGWSDSSESFEQLSYFLKEHDFQVVNIWLSDYLSMHDEITIYDLGQAMGKAIRDKGISEDRHSFDVIVHSTGGLVVRQYLIHYFFGKPELCPIRHLVMLAPANFGSPLASLGQSVFGRFTLGWKWDGLFQTGTKILDALKLASPISYRMAMLDLFNPDNRIFCPENIFTTILIGSDAYENKIRAVMHENGSDGTVRVSTANLNAKYIKLIFKKEIEDPEIIEVAPQYDPIAFGVLYNYDHARITLPSDSEYGISLGINILRSLSIESVQDYQKHVEDLKKTTAKTFEMGQEAQEAKQDRYHEYQNLVTWVHDQFNDNIKDYCIEFYQEQDDDEDDVFVTMHKDILEKVVQYSSDSGMTSFLFDITDLKSQLLGKNHSVQMSLTAKALSKDITYLNPQKALTVVNSDKNQQQHLIQPNTTLLVDIQLPRIQSDDVFKLRKA